MKFSSRARACANLSDLTRNKDEESSSPSRTLEKRKLHRFVPHANSLISRLNSAKETFLLTFPARVTRLIDPLGSSSTFQKSITATSRRDGVSSAHFAHLYSPSLALLYYQFSNTAFFKKIIIDFLYNE